MTEKIAQLKRWNTYTFELKKSKSNSVSAQLKNFRSAKLSSGAAHQLRAAILPWKTGRGGRRTRSTATFLWTAGRAKEKGEREKEKRRGKKKWKKEKNNTGGNSESLNYYVRTLQLNRSRIPPSPRLTDNNAKVVRTFTDKDLGQKYGRLQTNRAVAFSTGCRNFQGLSTFSTALPFFLSFFLPLVPRPSTRPQLSSHAFPRRSAG